MHKGRYITGFTAGVLLAACWMGAAFGVEPVLGDKPDDVTVAEAEGAVGPPVTLQDGRMLVNAGVSGKNALVRYSEDSGKTWGPPVEMAIEPAPEEEPLNLFPLLVSESGTIHFAGLEYYDFDFDDRGASESYLAYARSTDGGKTRSAATRIPMGEATYTGSVNSMLQLDSGRILAPISILTERKLSPWVSVTPYSDDDGQSWHAPEDQVAINTGALDWYESGAVEPVAIQLKDGRVWMLPRAQDGYQWQTFSEDGGVHWSKPKHTRFISNQSAMAVLRLEDGRLMLFWNNCEPAGMGDVHWGNAERAVLAAAISDDEGETWVGYREVRRVTTSAQVGYPYASQAPDGHVVVYAGGGPLVRVDPAFVTRTEFHEDFTQGLGRWSTLAAEGAEVTADPDEEDDKVLRLRKPNPEKPGAACINFPFGVEGTLEMTTRIEPGFQGAHFTLTDHYALPGLDRDHSFPLKVVPEEGKGVIHIIGSGGTWVETPGQLKPGTWHDLKLVWNCREAKAILYLDGTEVARIKQYVTAPGMAYLRVRSLAAQTDDAGLYLRPLDVEVTPR